MAILKGYRGNKDPEDNIKDITSTYGNGGGEDENPNVVSKTKTRVKKDGTVITKTKYKDTRTGEKGGSKTIEGPVKQKEGYTGGGGIKTDVTYEYEPFKPTVEKTPSTNTPVTKTPATDKPYVKPINKPSYEDAYEKADKTKYPTFDSFKEAAITWNKQQNPTQTKPTQTKPTLEKIPSKPAVKITPTVKTTISSDPIKTHEQEIKTESWRKRKNKDKVKTQDPPRKKQFAPPSLYSTKFSASCTKEGTCGPGQLYSSGMFGSPSAKDRRSINKQMRQYNRASRQNYRSQMADIHAQKRDARKASRGKSNTSYSSNLRKNARVPLKVKIRRMFS